MVDAANDASIFIVEFIAVLNGKPLIGVGKDITIHEACFSAFMDVFYNNGNLCPNHIRRDIFNDCRNDKVISVEIRYKNESSEKEIMVGNATVIYQGEMFRAIAIGHSIEEMKNCALFQCSKIQEFEEMALKLAGRHSQKLN